MSSISLTQLASQLGLGKSTVQRALSGTGKVHPETRKKILEAAHSAGYRRNLIYAALVAQRKRSGNDILTVHYVCRDLPRNDPRSLGKVETALLNESAIQYGMQVECVDPSKDAHPASLPRRIWNRGSAGMIIGNAGTDFLQAVQDLGELPILNLLPSQIVPYHSINFDVIKSVEMCWAHLWAAGHRRIGVVLLQHQPQLDDDFRRLSAARTLQEQNLPKRDRIPILLHSPGSIDSVAHWLLQNRPEAVIAFNPAVHWICQSAPPRPLTCVVLHANTHPGNAHIAGTAQPWNIRALRAIQQMDLMIRSAQNGIPVHRHTLLIDPVWYHPPPPAR